MKEQHYRTKLEITLLPTEAQRESGKKFLEAIWNKEELEVLADTPIDAFPIQAPLATFEENGINYIIFQNDKEILLLSNDNVKVGDLSLSRFGLRILTEEIKQKLDKPPLFETSFADKKKCLHKVIFNFTYPNLIL